jgi:transcription-repair coupling factor (superfamily II helicase)
MTTAALPEVAAAERMRRLERSLWESEGFGEAVAELAAGRPATFDGAWGSSCALLAVGLAKGGQEDSSSPPRAEYVVAVLPTQREADEFTADLELFTAERPLLYPAWERDPDEQVVQEESFGERLRTIKRLLAKSENGQRTQLLVPFRLCCNLPPSEPPSNRLHAAWRWGVKSKLNRCSAG